MIAQAGRSLIALLAVALSLVTVAGAQPLRFFGGIGDVDALTFTDDEKLLLATGYLVVEYDLETHAITKIHHPKQWGGVNLYSLPGRPAVLAIDSWLRPKVWDRAEGTVVTGEQLIPGIESLPSYPYLGWSPLVQGSPDGSLVAILTDAVGSAQVSELRIYDAATMELLDVKPAPGRFINVRPQFSEDGRTVYTAFVPYGRTDSDLNPSLLEWEVPGDQVRIDMSLFSGRYLLGIANGSDGLLYYVGKHTSTSCSSSGICSIIVYSSGSRITTYWESAILQPFNRDVVFNRGSSSMEICNADCPDLSYEFQGCDITLSPHGTYALQCGNLLSTESGEVLQQGLAHMIRFSSDDAYVTRATYDFYGHFTEDVYLVDTRDGAVADTIPAMPNSYVRDFTTIPKSSLVLGVEESLITAYDMVGGEALKSTKFTDCSPSGVVASPSGSHLAYRDDWNRFVVVGSADDLSTHGILLRSVVGPRLTFNPANDHLLVVAGGLQEYEIDPEDYAASPLVRTYDPQTTSTVVYTSAAYSPDGSVLLAARGGGVHQLHRYSTADGTLLSKDHLASQWDDLCFDPSGSFLLVAENGTRSIYDAETLEMRYTLTVSIHAAAFALNGRLIITTGNDAIKLWRSDSGEYLGSAPLSSNIVPDTIVPSPLEDIVYIADWQRVLEWRLPLRAALEHPEELQLDVILKREHTITPVDRNGDGVYDAADVLLEAQGAGP